MNTFLLIDNYEDCTIGIITTKMDYNEFEIELYNAKEEFNEVDYDTYENFYDQVFGIMWEKGLEFDVTYIDKKIYI